MFAAELEPLQVVSLSIGIVAVAIAGVASTIVVFEKITGSLGRWFERHFRESLEPTNSTIQDLRQEVWAADSYNRYHLGPNGDSDPIHKRIGAVEAQVELLAAQDDRLRQMLQAVITAEE